MEEESTTQKHSIEEQALKAIKRRLKETFEKIARDREAFDDAKDDPDTQNRLWAGAEALMGPAD